MVPSHGPRAVHETQTSEHVLEHRVDGVAIGQQVALATAEVRRVADFRRPRLQVVAGDADVEHLAVLDEVQQRRRRHALDVVVEAQLRRSEEHTSELQSLMRISYAVFCLKKKIKS